MEGIYHRHCTVKRAIGGISGKQQTGVHFFQEIMQNCQFRFCVMGFRLSKVSARLACLVTLDV